METMFGDATYTVSFDDGQESGVSEDALEAAHGDGANGGGDGDTVGEADE
jgi:hypothetical protein